MDIAGAKALKQRLGHHGRDEDPGASASADVREDAAPVYHYLGVAEAPTEAPDDAPAERSPSLLRRLRLLFR
jgi:hypothetical protein